MVDSSEAHQAALKLRKRAPFVFGTGLLARTCGYRVLGILIVIGIGQISSTAQGQDLFHSLSHAVSPELPMTSLLDWSVSKTAAGSPATKGSQFLTSSHISLEDVFQTRGWAQEHRRTCELVSCGACSDSCAATEPVIPWSRWDDDLTACEFATHDFATLCRNLDNDFISLWKLENVAFVGAGLGLSLGLRDSVDRDVRAYTAEHPGRWGNFSETLGILGNTEYQIAGMVVLYGYAYHRRDDELMDFTRLLVRSYTMTGLSTLLIKGITNTDRPSDTWNNGHFGFPSAHASTSFAIAATIEEYYGPEAGIPAYLMAGLIGWSRIDDRDHDLSDVVFGAVLGYAIAKSIAGQELRRDSRIRICPWMEPGNRTVGALWEIEF